jgi:3-methyl-2-oxobutanoate hydroxymethyltransferase
MKTEIKNLFDFKRKKKSHEKISMVTCYDFAMAQLVNQSDIDCILVGDSVAQVMHGHSTTLQATTAMMALHTQAVSRGAPQKFIVTDMPFLATRKGLKNTMDQAEKLMRAGAQALKIEGVDGHVHFIKHLVESGIPIMGHLGLTPQSIHQLGGPKIQGKNNEAAQKILQDALALQEAGCFSVVLECIPRLVSQNISKQLEIPTIGIGAGPEADGQVLVLQDLLGLNAHFNPKFLKKYLNGADTVTNALNCYAHEVAEQKFPTEKHSYESN